MFPKIVVAPKTIHFNRVFHYKPSILEYHCFWKHLYKPNIELFQISKSPGPMRQLPRRTLTNFPHFQAGETLAERDTRHKSRHLVGDSQSFQNIWCHFWMKKPGPGLIFGFEKMKKVGFGKWRLEIKGLICSFELKKSAFFLLKKKSLAPRS